MTKPKVVKRGRVRVQPYVEAEIAQRLMAFCAARGATETSVVQEALRQYLDGMSDATLYLRRLDRLGREVRRGRRDVELLSQAFAIWMKMWFAHTQAIPDEGKHAARVSSEIRYRQFADHLAEQFCGGKRFVDDLPREIIADEQELEEAGKAPMGGPIIQDPSRK